MKKATLCIIFLSIAMYGFAQDTTTKLKFHSVSFSFGVSTNGGEAGTYINFDVGMQTGPHIFRFLILASTENEPVMGVNSTPEDFGGFDFSGIFGGGNTQFILERDLLYGREFHVTDWLFVDVNAGLGHFTSNEWQKQEGSLVRVKRKTIGFPLLSKIRFQLGSSYGMGVQLHTNINNVKTIFSSGIFFQWKF